MYTAVCGKLFFFTFKNHEQWFEKSEIIQKYEENVFKNVASECFRCATPRPLPPKAAILITAFFLSFCKHKTGTRERF